MTSRHRASARSGGWRVRRPRHGRRAPAAGPTTASPTCRTMRVSTGRATRHTRPVRDGRAGRLTLTSEPLVVVTLVTAGRGSGPTGVESASADPSRRAPVPAIAIVTLVLTIRPLSSSAEGRALEPPTVHFGVLGPLAQLVEQGTLNPKVEGSISSRPTQKIPAQARLFRSFGRAQRLPAGTGAGTLRAGSHDPTERPDMASLIARHSRRCALGPRSTSPKEAGCTCDPTLYVVHREGGRLVRTPVGRDRKRAALELKRHAVEVHDGDPGSRRGSRSTRPRTSTSRGCAGGRRRGRSTPRVCGSPATCSATSD